MPMAFGVSMPISNAAPIVPSNTSMKKTVGAPAPPTSSSWEDMEYGGLLLAPLPDGIVVRNTFIDCPNAPSSSVDASNRGWSSCPNSGIMMMGSLMGSQQLGLSEIQSLVIPEGVEESVGDGETSSTCTPEEGQEKEKEPGELPSGLVLKNTFIDYPTMRSPSLDEYIDERGWKSCPVSRMQSEVENQVSEIQAAVIAEASEEERSHGSGGEDEEEPTTLRLLELLPRPEPVFSLGSVAHQLGQQCKPCGFVHKPEGCTTGANCQYCHLCPPGTIKHRKKVKKVMLRQVWQHRGGAAQGWY